MNVLICGIGGRMGYEVLKLAKEGYRGAVPVAGYDINPVNAENVPVYNDLAKIKEKPDVIIDFSHHAGTKALLKYAVANHIPTVVATTGHSEEELALIKKCAAEIPLFHAANMSLGVALLVELAKITAKTFPDADIEIIEKHHNRKLDAPSGTALAIANALKTVRRKAAFVFGRHGNAKREQNEIGIHAVRMGNIVGEHEVIVGTDTQTITLKHEAHSRALFAEGALAAAAFLCRMTPGLYDMKSLVGGEKKDTAMSGAHA